MGESVAGRSRPGGCLDQILAILAGNFFDFHGAFIFGDNQTLETRLSLGLSEQNQLQNSRVNPNGRKSGT
jgi:hypothetical protein